MLLYHNRSFVRLIFQSFGSVFFKVKPIFGGIFIASVTGGLQALVDEGVEYAPSVPHQYGMQALGAIVTFAVVFRTNLGWQRYWEAITQLHFMYSKWADAYAQFCGFAVTTIEQTLKKGGAGSAEKAERVRDMQERLEADFVLLSAMASDRLAKGDCARMEKRSDSKMPWARLVVMRESVYSDGNDGTGATTLPVLKIDDKPVHGEESPWENSFEILRVIPDKKLKMLIDVTDRTGIVMNWLIRKLAKISPDINIAPPIQSRMYQELSNGMLGFSNALKIADVPFPFPYAQLLMIILCVWTCFIPLYVMQFTQSFFIGPIMAFLLFVGVWCLNDLATELENPFGSDSNDICLIDFHTRFTETIKDSSRCFNMEDDEELEARTEPILQKKSEVATKPPNITEVPLPQAKPTTANVGSPPLPPESSPCLLLPAGDKAVAVIDQHLVKITERIEQHLKVMASELSRMSRLDGVLPKSALNGTGPSLSMKGLHPFGISGEAALPFQDQQKSVSPPARQRPQPPERKKNQGRNSPSPEPDSIGGGFSAIAPANPARPWIK
eukprot:TRINITY_DN47155_c0_g1_i1.p1 TRINITY_DN47155_c0_g1~~TRINITY_DN47155_c0_g1_i1.p1  ORF type:complete len:555 (-),score=87.97 TRINITY_DN47155_c0_g1_i1:187-1851(-)